MTFLQFILVVAASVGAGCWAAWAIASEHYHRRIAERDAALLSHRCGVLDRELRRRQREDELELAQLRDALQRTGPDWARGYQRVAAEELSRELEEVAALKQQLGEAIEQASLELTLLKARNEEHSRIRGTGSEPPS